MKPRLPDDRPPNDHSDAPALSVSAAGLAHPIDGMVNIAEILAHRRLTVGQLMARPDVAAYAATVFHAILLGAPQETLRDIYGDPITREMYDAIAAYIPTITINLNR
jgi:hypothetical protein